MLTECVIFWFILVSVWDESDSLKFMLFMDEFIIYVTIFSLSQLKLLD